MKDQYHIYGLGNALVDFEIEVTTDELREHRLEKGVMILMEQEEQGKLLEAFDGRFHSRACGGSAANTIIGAQTLGSNCFYSCKVANDEAGHFYKEDLLTHGVGSNLTYEEFNDGTTGKCLVFITEDADRTMRTHLGVTANINYHQVDESALKKSDILYIEGYLASSPTALETAIKAGEFAKANGIKRALSLSDPLMVKFCREGFEQIIGDGIDILFCNYEEALGYTNTSSLYSAIDALQKLADTVVVTLGEDGAVLASGGEKIDVSGHAVHAIDTNGAGDLFAGGFLHAFVEGMGLEKSGQLANYASSLLVTQFGPRLTDENIAKVKSFSEQLIEKG